MIIRKNVLGLAIPIMIEQTFVMLLGVCNTMMAGHIGKEAVSAIGMVDSINVLFISFFSALSVGATVVVAQNIGRKNIKRANETARQAIMSGIIISTLITLLIWIFRVPIINVLYGSAEPLVKLDAKLYIEFTLLTYPFIAVEQIANGILRGCGDTKTPMHITIFMNCINIILGYMLIYGMNINFLGTNIGFPSLGIMGAAIAIAVARLIGTALIIFVLARGTKIIKIRKIFPFKFDVEIQKGIFNIGIPAGVEQLLFNGGKLIVQVFIVTMGTISIASNSVAGSVFTMGNVPGTALTLAATALVGQHIGRGDVKEAKSVLIYLAEFATVSSLIMAIIFVPLASVISSLYTNNASVIHLSASLIRINAFAMLIWPLSFIFSAGLKGAGDTKYTMITSVIGMWMFRIITGYLLGVKLGLGVNGIWLGMYIDWIVRGILYCFRLHGDKWYRHKVI